MSITRTGFASRGSVSGASSLNTRGGTNELEAGILLKSRLLVKDEVITSYDPGPGM